MSLAYAQWTDREWEELQALCRRDGVTLSSEEVREAAFGYMRAGADGGGNRFGLAGTVVALNVDKVGAS